MNSHPISSVTLFFTIWFKLHSIISGSCEYPFQPVTNPANPKMFLYCNTEENSNAEPCPHPSTCEDLWLGLFVCCGYNTTVSNDTVEAVDQPKKLTRTEIKSLLLRNGKHIRMPHLEDQTTFTRESLTPAGNAIDGESIDEKNSAVTKLRFFTTQTIPLENTSNATASTTTSATTTTPPATTTTTPATTTTTVTSSTTTPTTIVTVSTTNATTNGSGVYLENLTLEQENITTGTTSLADFATKYKAGKDKRAELKTANGFRKAESVEDSKSAITSPQQIWNNQEDHRTTTVSQSATVLQSTKKIKTYSILFDKNNSSKPQVFILQEGLSRKVNATSYKFPATITLIVDHGKTVIVDTGMPTDYETLGLFLIELNRYGVDANAVDVVVTTHGHPDHFGHLNLFPSAIQIFGGLIYVGSSFTVSDLYMNELAKLTENVSVYKTPGHTAEDLSVVVKNVTRLGTVSVVGDLFFSKDDISYPELWESQSWNVTLQNEYRHMLLCISDYIVPGHGRMFKVDRNMKKLFKCNK